VSDHVVQVPGDLHPLIDHPTLGLQLLLGLEKSEARLCLPGEGPSRAHSLTKKERGGQADSFLGHVHPNQERDLGLHHGPPDETHEQRDSRNQRGRDAPPVGGCCVQRRRERKGETHSREVETHIDGDDDQGVDEHTERPAPSKQQRATEESCKKDRHQARRSLRLLGRARRRSQESHCRG
jgi:hypothetical protein